MHRILVAYDGSPEAEKAFEHSLAIAEPEDELLLLTVLPEPDPTMFSDLQDDISFEKASELLEKLLKKYDQKGIRINTKIIRGDIVDEIIKASEDPKCRLIVLGYKGVSRIGRFRLGSVSGEVAKRANKPVLIVK